MFVTRLSRAVLLSWLAASCPAAAQDAGWKAVLVAGDGSLPVFDNAVAAIGRRLGATGGSAERLSASGAKAGGRTAPATADRIVAAVAAMRPAPGQGCLVFATSHGVRHEGLYLSLRDEVLTPQALDRALVQGCGAAPTVVIVSSCYSGSFARPPMTRANRVILTASRADRTSFGCQAGRMFTVYDSCLLDTLDTGHSWKQVFPRVAGCVRAEERREDVMPSEPQAWFGPAVADLPVPVIATAR